MLGIHNQHKKGIAIDLAAVTVLRQNRQYAVKAKRDTYTVEHSDTLIGRTN